MAELAKKETRWVDHWQTDKANWEYISIPAENALGEQHAALSISGPRSFHNFEAGKTYLVPPAIATTLKERLHVYAKSCVRILQPKRDVVAESQVAMGTLSPTGNGGATDPSSF